MWHEPFSFKNLNFFFTRLSYKFWFVVKNYETLHKIYFLEQTWGNRCREQNRLMLIHQCVNAKTMISLSVLSVATLLLWDCQKSDRQVCWNFSFYNHILNCSVCNLSVLSPSSNGETHIGWSFTSMPV